MGNLGAIYKDIQDSGLDVDIFKYVNYGSFIINKNHKEFFEIASKTTHRNITETSFQTSVNVFYYDIYYRDLLYLPDQCPS